MLKFPFQGRLPRNQRFNIDPRFYDPVKEDIHKRKMEIKRELEQKKSPDQYRESIIEDSFRQRARENRKTSTLQIVLMVTLLVFAVLYLYF
ncbi:hypothetical protein AB9P05_06690 [Roseivirga sp. BDSF3-8]|uniref:hypothetical protein n=1 Tax=Roseivirga sp. BDSF3-8 TaxID=3241598 RepID=UPI0035319109